MRVQRQRMAWVVCLALSGLAGTAHGQSVRHREVGARLDLAAGYDSNPLLSVDPNARSGTTAFGGPGPGGVLNAIGDVYAVWGDAPWLGIALASDARLYDSTDARHDSALSLLFGTELGRVRPQLALSAGRYDASFGADNAWYGGARPALRWLFSRRLSLGVEGHVDGRRYADGGQTNWDLGVAFDMQLRHRRWMASLGVDVDRRQSTVASAERVQVTPFASLSVAADALTVSLRYAAFARWFDVGVQDGIEHTAELGARYALGRRVSVSARVGAGFARGQDDALSYERFYGLLGLAVSLGDATLGPMPVSPRIDRSQQGPAQVGSASTRFSLCIAGAHEVAVVGTFNQWSVERGRMTPTDADCYALDVAVPVGHHRYQWLIDGVLRRPDNAPAYASDGFGGEDAIVIVPE